MAVFRLCVAVCCLILAQGSKIEDVQDLNYEPKIAIQCGKVAKHMDVDSGEWIDDVNQKEVCLNDSKLILKYCQQMYPTIDVKNIVEANENVTLCTGSDCEETFTVIPYRCLVGEFEADALSYPPNANCDFGYIHEENTCKNHDYWRDRASNTCTDKGKELEKYGILVPCGTDMFTGVEYVCCKKTKTSADIFGDIMNQFASHIPPSSKGCNRSIYDKKARAFHVEKNKKVEGVAKNLKDAKTRMESLKKDDPQQAKGLFKSALKRLQSTLRNIDRQSKLDDSQVRQERRECIQIDINHKKHLAMKSFLDAVQQHPDKPVKILRIFKRFMRILQSDESQNARFLAKKLHSKLSNPKYAKEMFASHTNLIKTVLKDGVEVLKHVKSVAGKVDFKLPAFAMDIDFSFPKPTVPTSVPKVESTHVNPTDPLPYKDEVEEGKAKFGKLSKGAKGEDDDELSHENEHEDFGDHPLKSRAVFAAVIGLSCGALVIMVVIVLALFFRKESSKRPTKTVIAEDSQEERHLLKMQEDGFENPTYKFFAN